MSSDGAAQPEPAAAVTLPASLGSVAMWLDAEAPRPIGSDLHPHLLAIPPRRAGIEAWA